MIFSVPSTSTPLGRPIPAMLSGLGYDTSAYAMQSTQQAAQAQADAAAAAGNAAGIPTSCRVEENCSPIVIGGSPSSQTTCLYQALCSVNGRPYENAAGALLTQSGTAVALDVTQSQVPGYTTTPTPTPAPAPKPNQSVVTTQPGVVSTPNQPQPTAGTQMANAAPPAGGIIGEIQSWQFPSNTLLLLGVAGVALYLLGRSR